jgi:protein-S-isoprenylcysteine O-methyltransferase Ste14
MVAVLFGLYGLICYLIFFVVFLYAIAFIGGLPVPKTIDTGTPGALVPSLVVDALLLVLFAVQHSVMARPAFKRLWTRMVPAPIERSTYVLASSIVLAVLIWFWRPAPQAIWTVTGPGAVALQVLFWAGWGILLTATFLLSHFELFGLQQVYNRMRRREAAEAEFRTPLFYRLVRHPLYVGFILGAWATPLMTLGHLVFAAGVLGYILVAIQLEERDLIDVFGDRYRAYRGQVGMLVPRLTPAAKPKVEAEV